METSVLYTDCARDCVLVLLPVADAAVPENQRGPSLDQKQIQYHKLSGMTRHGSTRALAGRRVG